MPFITHSYPFAWQTSPPIPPRAMGDTYHRWRDAKLQGYPNNVNMLIVELHTAERPTLAEQTEIERLCCKTNMAIYAAPSGLEKSGLESFASVFGLKTLDKNTLADSDGISSVTTDIDPVVDGYKHKYIPYTNQSISWHTDGYYNPIRRLVRSVILHCVAPALTGGVNAMLDPEILYIRLYDESPDLVAALLRPDSMTIPTNAESARPDQSGPVFSCDPTDGSLHMRYTHRTHSIAWHNETVAAAARLRGILDMEDVSYIFRHRLESGQGLICNNVLHARTLFHDDPQHRRLLYRARFLERVTVGG